MNWFYCKSHLGIHPPHTGCTVITEGSTPRNYVPLEATSREDAATEVINMGVPVYPDRNMGKTFDIFGNLVDRNPAPF